MPLDFSGGRSVYQQIADDIADRIRAGQYKPGDRLPAQQELARIYEVAPETAKRGLSILIRDGVLETRSTRGTFVLRSPAKRRPQPDLQVMESALHRMEERLHHVEAEIAALRQELEAAPAPTPDPQDGPIDD